MQPEGGPSAKRWPALQSPPLPGPSSGAGGRCRPTGGTSQGLTHISEIRGDSFIQELRRRFELAQRGTAA